MWWYILLYFLLGLMITEQVWFHIKYWNCHRFYWNWPLVGSLYRAMKPQFEDYQALWKYPSFVNRVGHKTVHIVSSAKESRRLFASKDQFKPLTVPGLATVLTATNFVLVQGEAHKRIRRPLNTLFTAAYLRTFVPLQTRCIQTHIDDWLVKCQQSDRYQVFQPLVHAMNMDTSIQVFIGSYFTPEQIHQMSVWFSQITETLQPVCLPHVVQKAVRARDHILQFILKAMQTSRREKRSSSVLDAWLSDNDQEVEKEKQLSDHEIALSVITFIFASQDALTSAATWLLALLADHPKVMNCLRQEISLSESQTHDVFGSLTTPFRLAVVKEILRFRCPVLMFPFEVTQACPISGKHHTAEVGEVAVASIFPGLHDATIYPQPHQFDPWRFLSNKIQPTPQLVFGCGPHVCLGQAYVYQHLLLLLTLLLGRQCDWYRSPSQPSQERDSIVIKSTCYPQDGALLHMTRFITTDF